MGMLILTRKPGESIIMDGGKITIKILSLNGSEISLGCTAPKDVSINREEIHLQKVQEGKLDDDRFNR